jgi:hypothetical protein
MQRSLFTDHHSLKSSPMMIMKALPRQNQYCGLFPFSDPDGWVAAA